MVLGGVDADNITLGSTAAGTSVVLGDNGTVQMNAAGTLLSSVTTTGFNLNLGGDDTISVGNGNMVIFGGWGNDGITSLNGNSIIVGDNGIVNYYAATDTLNNVSTTDIANSTGGNDTIKTGNGNDVVLGGVDADNISLGSTAAGTSVVLGDNGTVQMNAAGTLLSSVTTTGFNQNLGGDDTISVGTGNMVIFGGWGNDSITSLNGNSIIVGDNGTVNYYAATDTLDNVTTSDTANSTGGNDTIQAGNGNTIAIGGVDADTIALGSTAGGTSIVLGDNGVVQMDSTGTLLSSITTTGFNQNLGGDDTISVGNGTMVAFGGYGNDSITAGTGTVTFSIFVGDNGTATYDATGLVAMVTTTDTSNSTGGNDSIKAGDGNDIAIGGVDNDTITLANGNAYVLGDNGVVNLDPSITSTGYDQGLGGNDVIKTGNGNHAIIGGIGQDTISSGNGTDYLFGDNGFVVFNAGGIVGGIAVQAQTLDLVASTGGADSITTLNGNKTIFGGPDNDAIKAGNGTHVGFGDEGEVFWTQVGVLTEIDSIEPTLGGNDVIQVGNGDSYLLGGAGADSILAGNSVNHNVIFGDNGVIAFDPAGYVKSVVSTDPTIGGDDVVINGNGNDILIGGEGNDSLTTGSGNNVLIGDSGNLVLVNNNLQFAETIYLFNGGNDFLNAGSGHNIELGGYGQNILVGSDSHDILIGNYGSVTLDSSTGAVTLVQRFGAAGNAPDLIGAAQDFLYDPSPEVSPGYVPTGSYGEFGVNGFGPLDAYGNDGQSDSSASDGQSSAFYEGGDADDTGTPPQSTTPDDQGNHSDQDGVPPKQASPAPVPVNSAPAAATDGAAPGDAAAMPIQLAVPPTAGGPATRCWLARE